MEHPMFLNTRLISENFPMVSAEFIHDQNKVIVYAVGV